MMNRVGPATVRIRDIDAGKTKRRRNVRAASEALPRRRATGKTSDPPASLRPPAAWEAGANMREIRRPTCTMPPLRGGKTSNERVAMTEEAESILVCLLYTSSRAFLASNGAPKHQDVHVVEGGHYAPVWKGDTLAERMRGLVTDLNICSNKGLSERFDSTIGAATVLMPFGGKNQLTPAMAMASKLPVDGETTTCSGMAWGFNPYLSAANPVSYTHLDVYKRQPR